MKQRIYNGHPLEFFNSSNDKKAEIKISGSDLILNPLDSSGTVIIGEAGTINDIEVGAVGTAVDFTFLGGGTFTSNGGTLTIGAEGDTIDLSNTTLSAISASVFTGSFVGDGTNLVNVVPDLSTYSGNVGVTGNLTVTGKVTAEEFHTEFVSASIIYMSGSTKFGDTSDDVHDFTGSINVKDGDFLVNTTTAGRYIQIDHSDDSLKFADNTSIKIGTGNDLVIKHTSAESQIFNSTGQLDIRSSTRILLTTSGGENMAKFHNNGAVELYYNNSKKFETLNTGISVTGVISGSNDLRLEGDANIRQLKLRPTGSFGTPGMMLFENDVVYVMGSDNGIILRNGDGSDNYYITTADHRWEVGSNEVMRLNSTGLGIGIQSPGAKLDVSGNIRTASPLQYTNQVLNNTVFSPGTAGDIATAQPFSNRWHDLFAFQRNFSVTQSISTNGTDFSDQTLDSAIFTRQSRVSTEVISDGERAVRFTFTGTAYCVGKYVAVFFGFSSPTPTVTITVESSANGTSWTSLSSGSVTASSNSHYVYLHTAAGDSGNNYLRVTFDKGNTDTKVVDICSLQLLTARHGDQGRGMEDEFPFTYDVNKKITLEGGAITGDNAKVISSRKFVARDGNGTMLTADDTLSGLAIADNGDGTFKGNGNNYLLRLDTDNNAIGDTAKIQFNDRAVVGWTGSAVYLGDGGENKDIKLQVGTGNINLLTNNQTRLSVLTAGGIQFHSYGSGNNTGTAAYNLQVDSSGNIIESDLGGGGTIDGSGAANRIAIWSDADTLTSDADFTVDGDTIFTKNLEASNNIVVSKDFQLGTIANNSGEFALGQTIANKIFNYGAEFQATNASIQIVLARNNGSSVTGSGAIGADQNNAFAVWETSGPSTLMEISQSGVTTFNSKVGINTDPHSSISGLHVNGDVRVDATDGVATRKIRSSYFSSTTDIRVEAGSAGDVILGDNGAARLTLSGSNQIAKFEGDVIINRSSVLDTAKLSIQADAGEDVIGVQCNSNNTTTKLLNVFNSSGVDIVSLTVNNDSTPDLLFNTDDGSGSITEALKLDSSQNATFANGVSIGDSGAVYGTDNASAGIFLRAANRGVSGEFASGYARNLIRSDGSATIEIGDTTSLISLIKLNAGSSGTNGVVSFMTKNNERMRVHHDGNVGIGATSPSFNLTVYDDGTSDCFPIVAGAGLSTSEFVGIGLSGFIASNGAVKAGMVLDRVGNFGTGDIHFLNNSTEDNSNATLSDSKLTIKEDGKVGIGTNSPSATLHVADASNSGVVTISANNRIKLSGDGVITWGASANYGTLTWDTGKAVVSSQGSNRLHLATAGNPDVIVLNGANVGIGTTTPDNSLEIFKEQDGDFYGLKIAKLHSNTNQYTAEYANNQIKFSDNQNFMLFNGSNKVAAFHNSEVMFYTNGGSERMRIDNTGSVGIGTTTPNRRLEVENTSGVGEMALSGTTGARLYFRPTTAYTAGGNFGIIVAGTNSAPYLSTMDFTGYNNGVNTIMTMKGDGKVGIGTTTPDHLLHVEFANTDTSFSGGGGGAWGSEGIRIENTSGTTNTMAMLHFRNSDADIHVAGIRQGTDDSDLGFFFEGTERVRFTKSGHVGIGTNDPGHKLAVIGGNIQTDGIVYSNTIRDNTGGNVVIQDNGGKVGIGTTSPGGTLHVVGQSGGAGEIYISDIDNGGGTSDGFLLTKSGTSAFVYNRDNGMLRFGSNDRSTDLTIGNSGNIGIGTTNTSKINSTTTFFRPDPNGKLLVMNHNSGSFINLETNATGGGDQVGGIYFSKTGNQSDAHFHVAGIDAVLLDHATDALDGGELRFFTKGTGAGDTSHHMILDHTGKLGIGQNIDPSYTLHVNASSTNEIARFASTDDDGLISIQDGNDTVYVGYDHSNTAMSLGFSNSFSSDNNITIKSDGKVGIGTTTPAGQLMVRKDQAGSPTRIIVSNNGTAQSGTAARLSFYEGTSEKNYIERRRDGSGKLAFVAPADDNPFVFENTTGEFLRFVNSKIGIGTTSPDCKVHIADTTTMTSGQSSVEVLKLQRLNSSGDIKASTEGHISMWATDSNNNNEWARISWVNDNTQDGGNENEGALSFWTNTNGTLNRAMYIDHDQKVGIGTTSPQAELEVVGDAIVTGKLTAQEFHTEFVSASIIYQSGSTKFGDTSDDNHNFTGSVNVLGNINTGGGNAIFTEFIKSNSSVRINIDNDGNQNDRAFLVSKDNTLTELFRINEDASANFAGNVSVNGQLNVGDSNADILQVGLKSVVSYGENTDVDTGTETVKELAIATYQAAFFDFVIKNGTNVRAGTVTAAHDGTNVEFNEVSTVDLGNTNDVKLSVDISGGNMRLRATTLSDNWSVKAFVRAIKV